jgi:putative transposase
METDWIISTLKQAIALHGKPEIINSDQESQFTSKDYINYVKSLESTKISMDGKGRAIDNVFIERFWRTIKYDKLYLYTIENGHHALELCEEFSEYYNYKRMHSSINDKTPMQVYKKAT